MEPLRQDMLMAVCGVWAEQALSHWLRIPRFHAQQRRFFRPFSAFLWWLTCGVARRLALP